MKRTNLFHPANLLGVALTLLAVPVAASGPSGAFFEDFESGLGQWSGRPNTAYSGQLMLDPLSSGRGQVLCFTNLNSGGDLFVSNPIALSGLINLSFDYLGLPTLGGTPGDLGGFLGIIYSPTATLQGTDLFWLAGTQDSYPGLSIGLIDDGTWHHYSLQLNASALPAFHLMLEDYSGSGGVPCDIFFDNLSVTPVPEPAIGSLLLLGLLGRPGRGSHRSKN
jgi:hypothetical protein